MFEFEQAGIEQAVGGPKSAVLGVATDTRKLQVGNAFFCIPGPNFDSHEFAGPALDKGASVVVIRRDRWSALRESIDPSLHSRIYYADDVLDSMQRLAAIHRRNQDYVVIGVTGSNGKTSAKEMLLSMLTDLVGDAVDGTTGNLNNHIGVPLTILNLKPNLKYAVIEMGMNHAGEIDLLASIAAPDHGLITSIGRAHIEFFYSKRGIARAKLELMPHCTRSLTFPADGIGKSHLLRLQRSNPIAVQIFGGPKGWTSIPAVVSAGFRADSARAIANGASAIGPAPASGTQIQPWKEFHSIDLQYDAQGLRFRIGNEDSTTGPIIENRHYSSAVQASNLLGCLAVLQASGFSAEQLQSVASAARPSSSGRFTVHRASHRILVDDSYNANPDSFLAALESLRKMAPQGRLLCLAGAMAELGARAEEAHLEVGRRCKDLDIELKACGHPVAKFYRDPMESDASQGNGFFFADSSELADHIYRNPQEYLSYDGILAKGSRSARMERACEALMRIGYV